MAVNHQWLLTRRPTETLGPDNFTWNETPVPSANDGEVLIRTVYLSLDPTNRVWASDIESYLPPVQLGDVMRGGTIGVVEASAVDGFAAGDLVQGMWGWQEYGIGRPPSGVTKLPRVPGVPLDAWASVLGATGLTAYIGLMDIGQPKPGETLVVTAAAGAVGSVVGQLGKIHGCRVVGIAGGPEKCRWLTEGLGFDAAIDYKGSDVPSELKRQCPSGIDILFENVGGPVFDACYDLMNPFGRIPLCGLIAGYNARPSRPSASFLPVAIGKRIRIEGFIILDHVKRFPAIVPQMIGWMNEGKLTYKTDIVKGLDAAPSAIGKLFTGGNMGKLLVEVSAPPA